MTGLPQNRRSGIRKRWRKAGKRQRTNKQKRRKRPAGRREEDGGGPCEDLIRISQDRRVVCAREMHKRNF